jgi:TolB-like protein/Flp pilus assembly protein TadD
VLGDGVNVAARVEPHADPGGICLSQQAFDQVQGKLRLPVTRAGSVQLKNLPMAMNLYQVTLPAAKAGPHATAAAPAPAARKSIAVLPLARIGADTETEYFSDGITEELINALSRLSGLRVVSRTSVFAYKGRAEDVRRIGEELKVEHVLEGSVRHSGRKWRIAVRLVNVADGCQVWGEVFERDLRDVFAIQSEVARRVVEALEVRLNRGERERLTEANAPQPQAYKLYLEGRFHLNQRTAAGLEKARECFQCSTRHDPGFAPAYAGLADCHALLIFYGDRPQRTALLEARAAAEKALALNPDLPEAQTSLGYVLMHHDWAYDRAADAFRRAVELNPAFATAYHWFGILQSARGRHAEAIRLLQRARELEPLSLVVLAAAGLVYLFARQYDRAIRACRDTLELEPNFALAREVLGQALLQKGKYTAAISEFETGMRLGGRGGPLLAALGYACARAGHRTRARRILGELLRLHRQQRASGVGIAGAHAGLGEVEEAISWLRRAFEERSGWLVYLKVNPVFRALHRDARFKELLRSVGLQ